MRTAIIKSYMPDLTPKKRIPNLTKGLFGITKMQIEMIDLNMIDWNKFFSNANVEEQVNILNDTLFNIFSNFVRSKVITVDVKDPP